MMEAMQSLFLEALRAALKNEQVTWEQEISGEQWDGLFRLAGAHHVLPLVYGAVAGCPAARSMDETLFSDARRTVYPQVMVQVRKTAEFLALYQHLVSSGVTPILVKGLVCRQLYPNPDYRASSDEDLWIHPEEFTACHEALLSFGMQVSDPNADLQADYEIPYRKPGSPLYIELHRHLFPPESRAYGDLNRFFPAEERRTEELTVSGVSVTTLECTDHLFYLICHAYKHFIHSGFGIRQLCDIGLFANAYGARINWELLGSQCEQIHCEIFVQAILKIARVHLGIDLSAIPEQWRETDIDETGLLADVLTAGVYGKSTESRVHSSNMTLDAVADSKSGTAAKRSLRSSLFPARSRLEKRYPYLKKHPALLPVAWASRIFTYGKEALRPDNNAIDAMNIGKDRIELLRKYQLID